MSSAPVITEITDGVGIMQINRPGSLNAFTPTVLEELYDALAGFHADQDTRAVVFTGVGDDAFCVGIDLGDEESLLGSVTDSLDTVHRAQRLMTALRETPIPVVAGVNGYAMGAGMDLALACDLRVVRNDARLCQSYVNVGLPPGDGGAYLLPRLVGEETAKDLILTGREISGVEAHDLGIASTVVDGDADSVRDTALERAIDLAAGPTIAIGHAKQLINESHDVNLETALNHAIEKLALCYETNDHANAVRAFNEKRDPEFTGT